MSLVQMVIRSIAVCAPPAPSLVVLRPLRPQEGLPDTLPIRIGSFEATAISMGVEPSAVPRPMTHDLLVSCIGELGGLVKEVHITEVHGTTFFAELVLVDADGELRFVDARPSDAIALAVRTHTPIYTERDVLLTASLPNFSAVEHDQREQEIASFHSFVEELSPEDFSAEQ